jgi:hypothetical protein
MANARHAFDLGGKGLLASGMMALRQRSTGLPFRSGRSRAVWPRWSFGHAPGY